jgi:hypothetical protein
MDSVINDSVNFKEDKPSWNLRIQGNIITNDKNVNNLNH